MAKYLKIHEWDGRASEEDELEIDPWDCREEVLQELAKGYVPTGAHFDLTGKYDGNRVMFVHYRKAKEPITGKRIAGNPHDYCTFVPAPLEDTRSKLRRVWDIIFPKRVELDWQGSRIMYIAVGTFNAGPYFGGHGKGWYGARPDSWHVMSRVLRMLSDGVSSYAIADALDTIGWEDKASAHERNTAWMLYKP